MIAKRLKENTQSYLSFHFVQQLVNSDVEEKVRERGWEGKIMH